MGLTGARSGFKIRLALTLMKGLPKIIMFQTSEELLSDSKEMYLVTIARLRETDQPVPLSQLAEALSVTSVSVNEMCRKLQDQGYLVYQPYQGAWLTDSGEMLAYDTLRRHRLWEVFLVDKLGFDFSDAHEIACKMEHAVTDLVTDRLEKYLGFPCVNPIGYPIPNRRQRKRDVPPAHLTEMLVGERGVVLKIDLAESASDFLKETGIEPGQYISIAGVGDNNWLIQINQDFVTISKELAQLIWVGKVK